MSVPPVVDEPTLNCAKAELQITARTAESKNFFILIFLRLPLSLNSFCRHTTKLQAYHKKKGAGFTRCYSEVSPNTYNHTTRKPAPIGASIHFHAVMVIFLELAIFRIHQARSKHFFFQYVLLNFYFIVHSFLVTSANIRFFRNKRNYKREFLEKF